jgi:alkylation response protein AidB-like acyl-CoA dehydrogenase
MVATSGTISSQVQLDGSTRLASQVLISRTFFALRQQQTAALVAEQAAARQAALRQRAAKLAARRAAAQAAADRAAQQQAQQAQQQTQPTQVTSAPAVPSGTAQQIAMGMLGSYGWSSSQFSCLDSLWNEESGWNVYATNPSSGAYGIPQALPGSKMASAGPDWQTDAATQIRWGLTYIKSLYGSPCGAWAHEEADGWY